MQKIKQFGKKTITKILERQVKRLRKKHDFTLVVVVGSVGKTSTKLAIAKVLSEGKNVRYQEGNYNDFLTVPLIFFGHNNPNVLNIFAWLKIFWSNNKQIRKSYPYDVVVAELGTDGPGQIKHFAYLKPEIAVVTAITPEHMEFFNSIDDVAKEELTVSEFSKLVVINSDDTDKKYISKIKNSITYGEKNANFVFNSHPTKSGQNLIITSESHGIGIKSNIKLLGKQGAKVALASVVVAHILELNKQMIINGLQSLQAFNGRMRMIEGINNSTIIDDTYNASPSAVIAGLDVVYSIKAPQKIAILGSMNELGDFSEEAHKQVGKHCDPKQLDLVVTIGEPARKFIATTASKKGCIVESFDSPYDAGDYVKFQLKKSALVFAKGSQNRVFAEETLKVLLKNSKDQNQLVRQSSYWLKIKEKQFGKKG